MNILKKLFRKFSGQIFTEIKLKKNGSADDEDLMLIQKALLSKKFPKEK